MPQKTCCAHPPKIWATKHPEARLESTLVQAPLPAEVSVLEANHDLIPTNDWTRICKWVLSADVYQLKT
ncbi:uncharacterized [Lates japonicus]